MLPLFLKFSVLYDIFNNNLLLMCPYKYVCLCKQTKEGVRGEGGRIHG